MPLPKSFSDVEFYVPEYLGPESVVEVISQLPRLRVVQLLTAGYDQALPHIGEGVTLCNAAGVHDASTAELAVGLCIATLRGFSEFSRAQAQGLWVHRRHEALADKRVLLLGFGPVGQAIAARLEPFDVQLTVVAQSARPGVLGIAELPRLLPEADVVVLAVPLTPATRGMVDRQFLESLQDGALLVNVSRGLVIDTEALVPELQSGRLRAALDVTDPEPLPTDHPLWTLPNVLITPHVGGDTSAFAPRAKQLLQAQLDRFAAGDSLANVVVGSPRGEGRA
jgi:phosphoglycerate dehydrogenase-like enzyme